MKTETTKIEFRVLLFVVLFFIIAIAVQSCSTQKHIDKSEQNKKVDSSTTAKKNVDTSKTTVVDIIYETIVYRDTTGKNITTERTINRVLHKNTYVYDTIHKTEVDKSEDKKQEITDKETDGNLFGIVSLALSLLAVFGILVFCFIVKR